MLLRGHPAARTLRILLVEDSPGDRDLAVEMLHESLPDISVRCTATLADTLDVLGQADFDIALVDLSLPDADGLDVLRALRRAEPSLVAVVVVTGRDEDAIARQALAHGAQDYLVKDRLDGEMLARAIRYAVSRAHAESEAQRSRTWAQSVLDAVESPTCAVDGRGRVVAVNAAWTRFAASNGGDPARCGIGADYLAVCDGADDPTARALGADLRRLLATGTGRIELDYPCHGPQQQRWFSLRVTPTLGGGAAVLTHVDVTALRQAHERLDHAASHDPLTGLANRRLLLADLDRRLEALQPGRAVAVLFIDLDRFKFVNDNLGHTAGDGVLVRIAAELSAAVRTGDLVARHGGDEFVVVADVAEDEVEAVAARLHAATSQRIRLDDCEIDVSASLGLVVGRAGAGDTADGLLRAVDDAMHEAKARGRDRVEVYTDELRRRAASRAQLQRELAVAVEHDQFLLHFQPIVVPDVGGVHAVEALLRWQHPTRGLLSPDAFLDVAEASGQMVPIGALVIASACAHGRRLHDEGLHLSVTVNLSAKQLNDRRTEDVIATALASTGFPAHSLIIEVTETTMIDDTDAALASLRAIKALGVQLAVDDFGTGYSSMSYIKRYPVDGLKIDRTFVRDMLTSSDDRAIIASTIKLARDLDLWVIAEGVETPEQLAALREMGCDLIQGFLYAKPMPAEQLLRASALLTAPSPAAVPPPREAGAGSVRTPPPAKVVSATTAERLLALSRQGLSLSAIAAALNGEDHSHPEGLRWHPRSVARHLAPLTDDPAPAVTGSAPHGPDDRLQPVATRLASRTPGTSSTRR